MLLMGYRFTHICPLKGEQFNRLTADSVDLPCGHLCRHFWTKHRVRVLAGWEWVHGWSCEPWNREKKRKWSDIKGFLKMVILVLFVVRTIVNSFWGFRKNRFGNFQPFLGIQHVNSIIIYDIWKMVGVPLYNGDAKHGNSLGKCLRGLKFHPSKLSVI